MFERASPEFDELLPEGDERAMPGTRAIIWLDIHKGPYALLDLWVKLTELPLHPGSRDILRVHCPIF